MQKRRQMHHKEYQNYLVLQKESTLGKTMRQNIKEMQNLDGIGTIQDLRFLYNGDKGEVESKRSITECLMYCSNP